MTVDALQIMMMIWNQPSRALLRSVSITLASNIDNVEGIQIKTINMIMEFK